MRNSIGKIVLLLAIFASSAFGQFVSRPSTNTIFPGGVAPGYAETGQAGVTNGTIRWDAATTSLQVHANGAWSAIGSGGSSFLPYGFLPYAFVISDATGGYGHAYGPRTVTNRTEALFLYGTGALSNMWPGQLMRNDAIGSLNEGNVYILTQTLYITNFLPHTTNVFPWAGEPTATNYWRLFVERGRAGDTGTAGANGADGLGNVRISAWSSIYEYDYDTNSLHLVLDAGRLYLNTTGSTNKQPSGVDGPAHWMVAVDKGLSGTVFPTNLVLRHAWDAGEAGYTNNDAVTYLGNLFYKGTGVTHFAAGVAPSVNNGTEMIGVSSTNWTLLVARGARGVTGADGNEVNSYSYYYNYDLIFTNAPTNAASAAHPLLAWVGSAGGTNIYAWVPYVPIGTNILSVSGTNLLLNGNIFAPGGGGGGGETPTNFFVRLTGEDNPVDLSATTVKIQDAVSPDEPVSFSQFQAGAAAAVTNAIGKVSVNGTQYPGLTELQLNDNGVTASANNGTLTVARAYSLFKDSHGKLAFTNSDGRLTYVHGMPVQTNWTVWKTYETSADIASMVNQNMGGNFLTNSPWGTLLISLVSESANVPRVWEQLSLANTNGAWRFSFILYKYPRGPVSSGQAFAIGAMASVGATQSLAGIALYRAAATPVVRGLSYANLASGLSLLTGGTATFLADPNSSLLDMYGLPMAIGLDYDPTTTTMRGFFGQVDGVTQPNLIQFMSKTNQSPVSFVEGFLSSITAGAPTSRYAEVDDVQLYEGGIFGF